MGKPAFRAYDDSPRRGDDIKLRAFGVEVEASGQIVVLTILCIVVLFVVVLSAIQSSREHAFSARQMEVMTCVLTLNEQERREFRTEGKYCAARTRFRDDGAERDERQRYSAAK